MPRMMITLLMMWLTTSSQFDLLDTITKSIKKEFSAITNPIEKTLVTIGFSQCKNLKKLLGVDYESFNHTELDMGDLALHFRTRSVNVSYTLSAASHMIPKSGWFNPKKPLKFYLHGFTDDPTKDSYASLSQAFLSQGDFNIVALDASSMISGQYLRATTMVQFIGAELGKILVSLVHAGLDPSHIHLIGHSLGSHISGFAGKTFTALTGLRVGRISGLDPAGPCFSEVNETLRLYVDDADFVDVIHTDAGIFGLQERIGHADFYPNGGSQQPDCGVNLLGSCSHSRAWLLFAESVSFPNNFVAINCNDWQEFRDGKCNHNKLSLMGYACYPDVYGTFFLMTADESPFGLGMEGVHYVNNEGVFRNIAHVIG